MHLEIISDYRKAKRIFMTAMMYDDINRYNYTEYEFNLAWKSWLNFYVLYNEDDVVVFCGIRKFNGGYGRIFDRYFIMPEYRYDSLRSRWYGLDIVSRLVDDCKEANLTPFFSIEKGRRSTELAAQRFNKHLLEEDHFRILDGLYETMPNSWQHIAIPYPCGTIFKRKEYG